MVKNRTELHYTDDTGLEADAVYQMEDGRYALIVICATAPMAYTTDQGIKIVPVGCLRD